MRNALCASETKTLAKNAGGVGTKMDLPDLVRFYKNFAEGNSVRHLWYMQSTLSRAMAILNVDESSPLEKLLMVNVGQLNAVEQTLYSWHVGKKLRKEKATAINIRRNKNGFAELFRDFLRPLSPDKQVILIKQQSIHVMEAICSQKILKNIIREINLSLNA